MATYSLSPEVAVKIAAGVMVVSSAFLTSDDKKLINRVELQLSINASETAAISYARSQIEMFSSDFLSAFTHMLAFNICVQLTGNSGLQQTQYQLAMAALQKAKYTTASEKKELPDYPSKYFDGRA